MNDMTETVARAIDPEAFEMHNQQYPGWADALSVMAHKAKWDERRDKARTKACAAIKAYTGCLMDVSIEVMLEGLACMDDLEDALERAKTTPEGMADVVLACGAIFQAVLSAQDTALKTEEKT